jgi:hypothetical protein
MYRLHHHGDKNRRIANVFPSSPILITLNMEVIRSSETTVLTRATRRNVPEDNVLYSHRRENLKAYTGSNVFCAVLAKTG